MSDKLKALVPCAEQKDAKGKLGTAEEVSPKRRGSKAVARDHEAIAQERITSRKAHKKIQVLLKELKNKAPEGTMASGWHHTAGSQALGT